MYNKIASVLDSTNKNHFGFDTVEITEPAQFTEYPPGGFYDWHTDNDLSDNIFDDYYLWYTEHMEYVTKS